MVEVGVHLIKNGTLHRRIVRVLLNVFFFYGVLLLSIFREWLYWIGVGYRVSSSYFFLFFGVFPISSYFFEKTSYFSYFFGSCCTKAFMLVNKKI